MTLDELEVYIEGMLDAFKLKYRKDNIVKGVSIQFLVPEFGILICGIDRLDYKLVNDNIVKKYPGWRVNYITTNDDLIEAKDNVLWDLMRSGYIKWLRLNYERSFVYLITTQGLGNKIINKRLEIFGNAQKYKFFIEDNKLSKKHLFTRVLALDPGFFDYMPEE